MIIHFHRLDLFGNLLNSISGFTILNVEEAETILTANARANFQTYQDLPIGTKYSLQDSDHDCGWVYIIGLPLFYFELEESQEIFDQVSTEVGL